MNLEKISAEIFLEGSFLDEEQETNKNFKFWSTFDTQKILKCHTSSSVFGQKNFLTLKIYVCLVKTILRQKTFHPIFATNGHGTKN